MTGQYDMEETIIPIAFWDIYIQMTRTIELKEEANLVLPLLLWQYQSYSLFDNLSYIINLSNFQCMSPLKCLWMLLASYFSYWLIKVSFSKIMKMTIREKKSESQLKSRVRFQVTLGLVEILDTMGKSIKQDPVKQASVAYQLSK